MNDLFLNNQPLVTVVLKRLQAKLPRWYFSNNHDVLKQQGFIGLYNASLKFDATKGYQFSTYAVKCISGMMHKQIENDLRGRRKYNGETISLETIIDDEITLADCIEYKPPEDVSWVFDTKILTERELLVCRLLYEGENQTYIGKQLGVSQVQVSRIIKKIRNKLLEVNDGRI